ncbi:MAG TPA: RDD family protein [Steroidobacteraceae bacterium]
MPSQPYGVSASTLKLQEQAPSDNPPYAGFWRRAGAWFLDYIIVLVGYLVLAAVMKVILPQRLAELLMTLLSLVAGWLYCACMESSSGQATLGKRAVGIKVTDLQGRRIGFGQASGRYFAHIVSDLTMGVGYVVAAFSKKRQTVHDMIAMTLVVSREFSAEEIASAGPAPRVPVALAVLAVLAMVLVGPIGIGALAAIALPAYQSYTIRSQIAAGLLAAEPYKMAVAKAYGRGRAFNTISSETLSVAPDNNLKYVDSVQVVSGAVVIKYGQAANRLIALRSLALVPGVDGNRNIVWVCGRIRHRVG